MILERSPEEALGLLLPRDAFDAQAIGDSHAEARCRVAVGVACARAQRDDAANEAYAAASDLAKRIHAPDVAGLAALNLGVLRLHAGKFADAREHLSSAIALFTMVNNEPQRLFSLYNAATVESEAGNAGAAADLYARTRDLAKVLGHRDVALGASAGAGPHGNSALGHVDAALEGSRRTALRRDVGRRRPLVSGPRNDRGAHGARRARAT